MNRRAPLSSTFLIRDGKQPLFSKTVVGAARNTRWGTTTSRETNTTHKRSTCTIGERGFYVVHNYIWSRFYANQERGLLPHILQKNSFSLSTALSFVGEASYRIPVILYTINNYILYFFKSTCILHQDVTSGFTFSTIEIRILNQFIVR